MGKQLLVLCVLFSFLGYLHALTANQEKLRVNCYDCQNCSAIDSQNFIRHCPKRDNKNFCVSYVEMWEDFGIGNVSVRGCGSTKGSCSDIKRKYEKFREIEIVDCLECYEDRCNSAMRSAPAYASAFLPLFIIPMLIKSLF